MSTMVRRGSSSPSLSSAVVILLIGGTSCVTVEAGKQKPLFVQGCDATFGVLVTGFARLGTPPALHGRGSTRTMHGVLPRGHRSRIVTSTYATVQDLRTRRPGFGSVPSVWLPTGWPAHTPETSGSRRH